MGFEDADSPRPIEVFVISVAGWVNQQQQVAIDYLREENRVLKEHLGCRRLRLNDDLRRNMAARAKRLAAGSPALRLPKRYWYGTGN
jgi:hypothetical protein